MSKKKDGLTSALSNSMTQESLLQTNPKPKSIVITKRSVYKTLEIDISRSSSFWLRITPKVEDLYLRMLNIMIHSMILMKLNIFMVTTEETLVSRKLSLALTS